MSLESILGKLAEWNDAQDQIGKDTAHMLCEELGIRDSFAKEYIGNIPQVLKYGVLALTTSLALHGPLQSVVDTTRLSVGINIPTLIMEEVVNRTFKQ